LHEFIRFLRTKIEGLLEIIPAGRLCDDLIFARAGEDLGSKQNSNGNATNVTHVPESIAANSTRTSTPASSAVALPFRPLDSYTGPRAGFGY
jgi:hypothetical protein